jgi:protein involved in polysaccharide export with SLBB domain
VLLILFAAPAAAQSSQVAQITAQIGQTAANDITKGTASDPLSTGQAYTLGTGDKIRVIVYGETNLGGEFVIDGGGYLRFPLIGQVRAGGMTAHQIEEEITAALKDGYLQDPHVNVEVETYRPFYIIGEVNKPGEYPCTFGLSIINAVALAGGFTYRADEDDVYIRHKGDSAEFKLQTNNATPIAPGDIVRVAERFF